LVLPKGKEGQRKPILVSPFSRLSLDTNLNPPPSNWLRSHPSGAHTMRGFGAAPPQATSTMDAFAALRMAGAFLELLGDVDVMADADIIKKLLKLPYSSGPISLVVHRVGKSLLVDDFDIHGFLLRSSEEEWKWLK